MPRTLDLTPESGNMLKPRELIELRGTGPLTLQDRRVFNTLIENAWGPNLGKAGHWFEIDTGKLRDAAYRNSHLSDSLERLMRTICLAQRPDGSLLRTPLLSSNELKTGANSGTLKYKITEELAELLKDSSIFAKLDLQVMKSFSSKYAFSLYEAVSRRIKMRMFMEEFSIEDMRELLGVEEGKLGLFKNLNNFAIKPALAEVNAITPYDVTIKLKKEGKKVVSLVMGWNEKSQAAMIEAHREMERHRLGRKHRTEGTTETITANREDNED